jgi:ABC-2 type transport system permease protein
MSESKTGIVIRREYTERVHKKSFIISTILVPVFIVLMSVLPAAIMFFAGSERKTIAVIDDSGIILPQLKSSDEVNFIDAWGSQEDMLANDSIYGVLIIDRNVVNRPSSSVKMLTPNSSSMSVEASVTSQMEDIIEAEKLKNYDIENLDKILDSVKTTVVMQTVRTNDAGEEESTQSASTSAVIGTVLNFLLYMFLLLYGSLVMNSIIEEKNNRVLEIVVSSIKPTQLLLGKIVGVGLVALTQILIWAAIMVLTSSLLLPALIPADVMSEVAAINAGTADLGSSGVSLDMATALGLLTNIGYILKLFGYLILFLIGGYMLYASIFAAIGAAVDNVQDASQLQMVGVMPIIIGLISSFAVIEDPNSTFAVVMSLIPFTSPMVMMTRIPFDVAAWQVVLSLVLLYAGIFGMIWVAAKIYRVGIFMYGQKPTFRSLMRWVRYK